MRTKIIYEDASILVVHKSAGLATQTAHVGQQDVVSELKNYLRKASHGQEKEAAGQRKASASAGRGDVYLGVVHRLDQPVEGLLVFAKTKEAAAGLTGQLSEGTLNKQYYALLCGKPEAETGELVDYLVKDGSVGRIGSPKEQGAKQAVLQYRIVKEWNGECALADVYIETGRFHQIRLQFSHAGHPILGDLKYGSPDSLEMSRRYGIRNVALYACRLEFQHPVTGKKMEFSIKPGLPAEIPS